MQHLSKINNWLVFNLAEGDLGQTLAAAQAALNQTEAQGLLWVLNELPAPQLPETKAERLTALQLIQAPLRAMETSGKPWAAWTQSALSGSALEVFLAAPLRLASPQASFSAKEGYLPQLGAWQRSTRLMGLDKGLNFWLEAQALSAEQALKQGLVQQLAQDETALAPILEAWLSKGDFAQIWDKKGYAFPEGPSSRKGSTQFFLNNARVVAQQKTTPWVRSLLGALHDGLERSLDRALDIERRYVLND